MTDERIMEDEEIQGMIKRMSRKMARNKRDPLLADDFAQELFIIMRKIDGNLHPQIIRYQAWKSLIDVAMRSRRYNYSYEGLKEHVSLEAISASTGVLGSGTASRTVMMDTGFASGAKGETEKLTQALSDDYEYDMQAIERATLCKIRDILPDNDWEILNMKYGVGLTDGVIATGLGVSRSQVSKRRNKTLEYLRSQHAVGAL